MAEESQQTSPNTNPEGTDGKQEQNPAPAATQTQGQSGAATDDDEMVSIRKSDLKNLQSQRDSNHERARVIEQHVIEDMQRKDIQSFLGEAENKKKFPDVTVDDLMVANDPEEFASIAGQTQARIDDAVQKRLADTEKATTPVLSPDERAAQEKKLKANPGKGSFQKMLELRSTPSQ